MSATDLVRSLKELIQVHGSRSLQGQKRGVAAQGIRRSAVPSQATHRQVWDMHLLDVLHVRGARNLEVRRVPAQGESKRTVTRNRARRLIHLNPALLGARHLSHLQSRTHTSPSSSPSLSNPDASANCGLPCGSSDDVPGSTCARWLGLPRSGFIMAFACAGSTCERLRRQRTPASRARAVVAQRSGPGRSGIAVCPSYNVALSIAIFSKSAPAIQTTGGI